MDKKYEVKIDQFSGPLEKLLELIEERRMEITAVNLAEITNDFLEYLQTLAEGNAHPSVISDFIVIASKLLLIKSKALLPSLELTEEEERDVQDLELRLKIYKEFSARGESSTGEKNAASNIKELWEDQRSCFSRELFSNLPPIFYPPAKLKISDMSNSILNIITELQALIPEQKNVKKAVMNVKEKMEELLSRFKTKIENSFKEISESKSKLEIIILFLAVLHLIRDRLITSTQNEQFSDIIIKQKQGSAETAAGND